MKQRQSNISTLPKLRSYTHRLNLQNNSNYSTSFKTIFNHALSSVQKKLSSRHKLIKPNNRIKPIDKSLTRITETVAAVSTPKEEYNSYTLPPMMLLSKVLKASRKSTILGEREEKEEQSFRRSRDGRDGMIQKRKSVKLAGGGYGGKVRKERRFFKTPKENPEDGFAIEPWYDEQVFTKRF